MSSQETTSTLRVIHEARPDGTYRITAAGELDLVGVQAFAAAAIAAHPNTHSIKLDLGHLTFIDSTGLRELLRLSRLANERHRPIHVTACSHQVHRMLFLTGLENILQLPTLEA